MNVRLRWLALAAMLGEVSCSAPLRGDSDAGDGGDAVSAHDVRDATDTSTAIDGASDADVARGMDGAGAIDAEDSGVVVDALDVDATDEMDARDAPDVVDARIAIDASDTPSDAVTASDIVDVADVLDSERAPDAGVPECALPSECPGMDNECQRRTCALGRCGFAYTASSTPVAAQTPRDCRRNVCNGMGIVVSIADDGDLPDDSNSCTQNQCTMGAPRFVSEPLRTLCTMTGGAPGVCNGSATMPLCVSCVGPSDCPGGGACSSASCQAPSCTDGLRNGTEVGVDCGGSCPACAQLVLLATSLNGIAGNTLLAASYDYGTDGWVATDLAGGRSGSAPSVAVMSDGRAVGVVRYNQLGDPADNRLRYTVFNGTWGALADVGPTLTTREAPSMVRSAAGTSLVFHGQDFFQYVIDFDRGTNTWSAVNPTACFGPAPAAIAASTDFTTVLFANGAAGNVLESSHRAVGSAGWQVPRPVEAATNFGIPPSLLDLGVGVTVHRQHAVYVTAASQITTRSRATPADAWGPSANVSSALTGRRVALTARSGTVPFIVFRGGDANLYYSEFSGSAFAAPMLIPGTAGAADVAPSVTRGTGNRIEVVYVNGAGLATHVRLSGALWSPPTVVGGANIIGVAIASVP